MVIVRRTRAGRRSAPATLALDEALLALFIHAMDANGHVSPRELERAHHLIWFTRRFRRKSGDTVARMIDAVRTMIDEHGPPAVMKAAIAAIPARLAAPAFAVLADLLLADGHLDALDWQFLRSTGTSLKLDQPAQRRILDVTLVKNQL